MGLGRSARPLGRLVGRAIGSMVRGAGMDQFELYHVDSGLRGPVARLTGRSPSLPVGRLSDWTYGSGHGDVPILIISHCVLVPVNLY